MAENQGIINAIKESNKNAAVVIKDELKDQLSPFTSQITAPLQQINAGINALPGVGMTKKLFSAVTSPLKGMFAADKDAALQEDKGQSAQAEVANQNERDKEANMTLMEDIRDGIIQMKDGIINGLSNLKDKGLLGLGVLAGLVAAPFVALTAFFTQLMAEVRALDKILKGRLTTAFAPIVNFFKGLPARFMNTKLGMFIDDFLKAARQMFTLNLEKFKGTGFGTTITNLINRVKGLFRLGDMKGFGKLTLFEEVQKTFGRFTRPLMNFITRVKGVFATVRTGMLTGFAPITKFAATIGRTLGKIFLPITVLMTVIDFVKGFMTGYKSDGLIGGITEGIIAAIDGLVGGLIRLVTGGIAWILEKLGLDKFAESLTTNVNTAIMGAYEIFRSTVDVIMFPFKLIWEMIKGIFGGETDFGGLFAGLGTRVLAIFEGLIDIITAPFNMIYGLIQDIFSFAGFELPDFDLAEFVKGAFNDIIEFFKGLINIDIGAIVDSLPGPAKSVLKALGVIDETSSDLEAKIAEAQDRINRSESGENVYFGREGKGREEDAEEIAELQKQLEEMRAQQGNVVVNNYNNTDNSTNSSSSTVTTQPLKDTAAPAGTVAAM